MFTFNFNLPSFSYILSLVSPFADPSSLKTETRKNKRSLEESAELTKSQSPLKKIKTISLDTEIQTSKRSLKETAELIELQSPLKKAKYIHSEYSSNLQNKITVSRFALQKNKHSHSVSQRRIYLPETAAPCIKQSLENKAIGKCEETSIQEHAYLRIQVFAIMLVALCGAARRSDSSKVRELFFSIQAAYLQAAKATNYKEHKYDAAHYNAASGFTDQIRNSMMEEICSDLTVTPMKMKFLLNKGFTEEDFAEITKSGFTRESVEEVFNRIWPICKSILFNTETDFLINGTTEVLKIINLSIDKALETVLRPYILELLKNIAEENIPPSTKPCAEFEPLINKTKNFHQTIVEFFTLFQKTIGDLCKLFQNYEQEFQKLDNYTTLPKNDIADIIQNLLEIEKQLCPPKPNKKTAPMFVDHVLSQLNEQSQNQMNKTSSTTMQPVKRIHIPRNKKFLKDMERDIYNNQNNSFYDPTQLLGRWEKKFSPLKDELKKQGGNLKVVSEYVAHELKGSQLPQNEDYNFFKALFGNESLEEIQKRLLKPRDIPINQTTYATPLKDRKAITLNKPIPFNQTVKMLKV